MLTESFNCRSFDGGFVSNFQEREAVKYWCVGPKQLCCYQLSPRLCSSVCNQILEYCSWKNICVALIWIAYLFWTIKGWFNMFCSPAVQRDLPMKLFTVAFIKCAMQTVLQQQHLWSTWYHSDGLQSWTGSEWRWAAVVASPVNIDTTVKIVTCPFHPEVVPTTVPLSFHPISICVL